MLRKSPTLQQPYLTYGLRVVFEALEGGEDMDVAEMMGGLAGFRGAQTSKCPGCV